MKYDTILKKLPKNFDPASDTSVNEDTTQTSTLTNEQEARYLHANVIAHVACVYKLKSIFFSAVCDKLNQQSHLN
jgi:hypothetical protein